MQELTKAHEYSVRAELRNHIRAAEVTQLMEGVVNQCLPKDVVELVKQRYDTTAPEQ